MKKPVITEKHIEAILDENVLLDFPLYGNVNIRLFGRIIGRVRNRFKQYIFIPTIAFSSVRFSIGDVSCIEPDMEFGHIVSLKNIEKEPRKRKRRKKKVVLKSVAMESNPTMDLSQVLCV